MAKKAISAGVVLYRRTGDSISVLLVHPSGNYNRKAPWGIPKGHPDEGETLEAAARRECFEETGVTAGELVALGHVDYTKSKKRVHAFAGVLPDDAAPRCASWEVDCAEIVSLERARAVIHADQARFLDALVRLLDDNPGPESPDSVP
jgi:predicted NUDIX family NTP pyrophosphohydrolase